jgi:uncharacterized damage-inducible protein DinB
MERIDPESSADELTMLTQYLDFHRATFVQKASGLTKEQMGQRVPSSALTLAGLCKHLALNEDSWFSERVGGRPARELWRDVDWDADPDWEFRTALDEEPEDLLKLYAECCEASRQVVAEAAAEGGLDTLSKVASRTGNRFSLRWIILHMIEETARHNGHADLLRENVDGVTGE